MPHPHPIRFETPYFTADRGASLHRYGDAEFISRFQQDVRRAAFSHDDVGAWRDKERTSDHDDALVLRLPLHRSFYVVCSELVCDRLGNPPVDPARIASAGYVLRRIGGRGEQGWMVADGEAIGWQPVSSERRDPDVHRRLCRDGRIRHTPEPAYSGEQTHPLHVLEAKNDKGRIRTLLFGYVALGGFYYHRDTRGIIDAAARESIRAETSRSLSFPFAVLSPQPRFRNEHATAARDGRPSLAFYRLLRMLVMRDGLGATPPQQNAELENIAGRIFFYDTPAAGFPADGFSQAERAAVDVSRRFSLLDYLTDCFAVPAGNPLIPWMHRQDAIIRAHPGDASPPIEQLPERPPSAGHMGLSVFLSSGDAEEMRTALYTRTLDRIADQARELPVPKFQQRAADLFEIVPFARVRDDDGHEELVWADAGERSERFRVAGPLDPTAARPSLIPVPSIRDVKRGLAQGVAMAVPPDTMDLLNAIDTSEGVSEDMVPDEVPEGEHGMQWLCSFSIPIVTIAATILLMIIVSLLDIVMKWMPYVRVCIPMPDIGGSGGAAGAEEE